MISDVHEFTLFFLENLPDFLMSEPICYFVGFSFLFLTLSLIKRILRLT